MYETNNTDFKPKEGDLPETVSRLKMEEEKASTKKFSDNDSMNVMISFIAVSVVFAIYMFFKRKGKEEEHSKELEKDTNAVNMAKTTIAREDLKFSQDSLQAELSQTHLVKDHKKETGRYMSEQERKLKQLTLEEEGMILTKPRNFRKEAQEKLRTKTEN